MTKNNLYKKLIACFLAIALFTQITGVFSIFSLNTLYAYSTTSITVTNGNFESDEFSGLVISPTSWAIFNGDANVNSGVIDISTSEFNNYSSVYGLSYNPSKHEFAKYL